MCLGEEKGVPSLHSVYKCAVTRGGGGGKRSCPPTRKHNSKECTPGSESQQHLLPAAGLQLQGGPALLPPSLFKVGGVYKSAKIVRENVSDFKAASFTDSIKLKTAQNCGFKNTSARLPPSCLL